MPSLANITVKKNDGTTDITYTGVSPASGSNPASWKATSVGSAPAHQPEFRLLAKDASNGASRALRSTYQYPRIVTDTTTSIVSVIDKAFASTDWNFPKSMTQADINEFVSQYANLLVSTLIKDCVKAGYAAT